MDETHYSPNVSATIVPHSWFRRRKYVDHPHSRIPHRCVDLKTLALAVFHHRCEHRPQRIQNQRRRLARRNVLHRATPGRCPRGADAPLRFKLIISYSNRCRIRGSNGAFDAFSIAHYRYLLHATAVVPLNSNDQRQGTIEATGRPNTRRFSPLRVQRVRSHHLAQGNCGFESSSRSFRTREFATC